MRCFIFLLLCFLSGPVAAKDLKVVDGDTIDVDGVRYKLNGIDAPERGQSCVRKAGLWNCGAEATNHVSSLVQQGRVACKTLGTDPVHADRRIGFCTVDGQDIGALLISAGLAWAYRDYLDAYPDYTTSYLRLETDAKARGLGIWQSDNQPPWAYRRDRWQVEAQIAPEGCPIKGNISSDKIYHLPWDRNYADTRISLKHGERWFCSEQEAEAAGWRRAKR